MVYSSCAVAPSDEQECKVTGVAGDHLQESQAPKDVIPSVSSLVVNIKQRPNKHPPSKFVDSKGNLKFVNIVVAYPCAIFLFILGLCLVIVVAFSNMAFADGNPFTPDTNTYDLFDERSVAYDSLMLARENVKKEFQIRIIGESEGSSGNGGVQNVTESEGQTKFQERLGDVTYWIYEAKKDGGLFTKEALEHMRSSEIMLTKHVRYPSYCWLQHSTDIDSGEEVSECRRSKSVVNIFYASEWNSTLAKELLSQLTKENVRLYNSLASCVELNYLCDFIPSDATEDDKRWVRSMAYKINSMMVHWDGEGVLNTDTDEVSALLAVINKLYTKAPVVKFFFDTKFTVDNPVTMYTRSMVYWGAPLSGAKDDSFKRDETSQGLLKKHIIGTFLGALKDITRDDHNPDVQTYYFMGTLIFDIIIDILLSDVLKAVMSFVAVFFYLRLMIGSWFLAAVGMLEIFMSLPLAWFFSSYVLGIKYFSTLNVLCIFIVSAIGADDIFVFIDAYRQSANKGEEVLESLETRMSWVYRRSGQAMAITSATTCSAFLCTIVSPIAGTRSFGLFAALVILFDYILVMTLFCTAVIIYHDRFESKEGCCNCLFCFKEEPTPTETALARLKTDAGPKMDRITFFFRERFAPFILKPRNRIMIAIPMIIWIVLSSVYTTKLEPTRTAEQALDQDHPLQRGADILNQKFPTVQEDPGSKIHFVWGLEDVDRIGVNQLFDPDFVGDPVFVEDFEFNQQCQSKMLEACEILKTDEQFEGFIKRKDGFKSVDCFVEELGAYNALSSGGSCDDLNKGQWKSQAWQVDPSDLSTSMDSFVRTNSCYGGSTMQSKYSDSMGWNGTTLRYAGISIESDVLDAWSTLPEEVVRVQYETFIEFKQVLDATMEDDCQSRVIMTDLDQKFIFMNNQRIYRTSAISGSMLGVAIAFTVLLISTKRFHIAFFATISIFSVLVGVMGSVSMMGWTLGTNESILVSILAGFSVDYVVHLAHAYVHAEGDVQERTKEAFGDMGISVFSGMLTSVVASIPLFMCTLTFFAKFGTFLCLTIVFSWIFANFGFMSLLVQFQIPITKKIKTKNDKLV